MVKKIIWSKNAENKFLSILQFWIHNNQSIHYSEVLIKEFSQRIKIISQFPDIGINCGHQNIKFTIVEYYRVYYQISKNTLRIIYIFDTRQDPTKNRYV